MSSLKMSIRCHVSDPACGSGLLGDPWGGQGAVRARQPPRGDGHAAVGGHLGEVHQPLNAQCDLGEGAERLDALDQAADAGRPRPAASTGDSDAWHGP